MAEAADPTPTSEPPNSDERAEEVRERLRAVVDPELGDTIVDLGMVRGVAIDGGDVTVKVALTIAACPLRNQIEKDVVGHVQSLDWVRSVRVDVASMDADERAAVMARARWKAREDAPETAVPADARVLAIASGKGGVGKSSVTVNLAVALAARGMTVGVLDADIWGFSVPRLLGMEGDVEARTREDGALGAAGRRGHPAACCPWVSWPTKNRRSCGAGSCSTVPSNSSSQDAHWGDLDYLLIDLPPGTGDIQMGLARLLPRTELLVVTTPPVAAQKVAARAADMARRGYLRVAGVIENMSDFTCEHGTTYALFGSGGGERLAHGLGVPLVGSIPLHPDMAAGGDAGVPVALADDGELATVFADLARVVAEEVAPLIEAEGCTARHARTGRSGGGAGRSRSRLTSGQAVQRLSIVSSLISDSSRVARPSWARARRWAHSEKRATGSCCSVTSP